MDSIQHKIYITSFGANFAEEFNFRCTNVIQFVTISTTGDAVDFGDCVAALKNRTACSDVHGGLAQ